MNRRVDEKLHLAKLALAAIDVDPAAETALAEAALFHLHVAYRAYLRELLDQIKLVLAADSAQQVAEHMHALQLHSADIDELANLEQSGEWPAQLQVAYAAANNIVAAESTASSVIALRDVTTQIDSGICSTWLQQFRALLQRQRAHAQEW